MIGDRLEVDGVEQPVEVWSLARTIGKKFSTERGGRGYNRSYWENGVVTISARIGDVGRGAAFSLG